jgi:3-hydroxyacyl-CoA dehydrogenase
MASPVATRRAGAVAVLVMANPPVNGLSHAVRGGVVAELAKAVADPSVDAIVLTGNERVFSAGADIREFDTGASLAEPNLSAAIDAVEASPKPVVAAISGVCMGGGFELALGCHARVVRSDARIALPEVKIGILPGAGGTQRLPRLAGVRAALETMISGETLSPSFYAGSALFDRIVDGDVEATAIALAEDMAAGRYPVRRPRDIPIPSESAGDPFEEQRKRLAASKYPIPAEACLDCVRAATTKSFEEGLAIERGHILSLIVSDGARALRHVFFAEREASKIPGIDSRTSPRPIRTAAIVGAGTMGRGIAMAFANAGLPVSLTDASPTALAAGLEALRRAYETSVARGSLDRDAMDARLSLITPARSLAEIAQADIVIEAVFEDIDVKRQVFEALDSLMKPGAILASNTSTLDLDRIASFTKRPGDVVGAHFFSPANVMRLLEIVRGRGTAQDALATMMSLAKRLGKVGVVSGVCDGFIGNRMLEQYLRQAYLLLEEGALPAEIDRALEDWGFAMGPFRMSDLAGNDIGWAIRKRRASEKTGANHSPLPDRLCEQGRFGQKTGAGWYRYEPGKRTATPDLEVERMIVERSAEAGIARRRIDDDEIVERCWLALVNEGARILEEGVALRASDIDVVYTSGYGFPRHRGGPMFAADRMGLPAVHERMQQLQRNPRADPDFWRPAPLIGRLAAESKGFNA